MTILYITNGVNGPGGLERVLSIKASYFAENLNYEVHILTLNQATSNLFYEFSPKITYHNITATGNPISYIRKYRRSIKENIKKIKPDLTIVCDDGLKGLMFPIIIGKKCPTIYERHVSKNIEIKTEEVFGLKKIISNCKFMLMDFGAKKFDEFIVLTDGNKKEWNVPNLKVIENPLSFYPKEKSTLNNKKVIAVGKQSFQKGYDRLLKSWQIVSEKNPEWKLEIYGTIDESEGLNDLVEQLEISKTVNFFTPVKNIGQKYKEASIYVMSSRYEGFGMVLTEAMAYGVPCVSYDCPHGPSDIITHNENGFIVPNGNINELAKHIDILINDDVLRANFGKNAKEDVKRYLPKIICNNWINLFKELTNN